ncbi:hypothetical protein EV641_1193 [Rhodococcus sp. SMB37]|nr:hypothetical protein EV641_1193 [Rhodococcus sp. SMB37]
MMLRRGILTALAATTAIALSSCTTQTAGSTPPIPEDSQPTGDGHGAITGAEEVAEPPLHLVSIDAAGAVGMLDLLDDTTTELGTISAPSAVATDGRYLFSTTPQGVDIVDSGVWTWDHVDHFHYYRADPKLLGKVTGEGAATVSTSNTSTIGGTGLFFPLTGEAVLLDNEALSQGEIRELFRIETGQHSGLAVPLGGGALVTHAGDRGQATEVRFHRADGTPVDGSSVECPDAQGTITTRVGVVIGCATGALLATAGDGEVTFEHLPYPEGTHTQPAVEFDNRKGRPSVAARAGDDGIWLLDTRARTWQLIPTTEPLLRVSAADDAGEHIVALDRSGRVRVYDGSSGDEVAATEPLLARSLADPALLDSIELTVDRQRAYLNAPAEGVVYEIAYADNARLARMLETPTTPTFFAETGR